jgi:hypothetical protein
VAELETLSGVGPFFFYFLVPVVLPKTKGYLKYPTSQLGQDSEVTTKDL